MAFFGWVQVGVGERDFFLAECGWVWVSLTFSVLAVCDFFLAGCGWVWVSVNFFWMGVGGCV